MTKQNKDYIPISLRVDLRKVLERNQEIFKLLDWYLAQNIWYRNRIKRLKEKTKRLKKLRKSEFKLNKSDFTD